MANLDELYDIDHRTEAFVNHERGLLVCLAGPGTGKTFSFLARISALTAQHGVPRNSICYLTFIKEISKAFLSDYRQEFANEIAVDNRPRISTLHSFACRLIRNRGFSIGLDGPLYFASMADPDETPSRVFLADLLPIVTTPGVTTIPQLRRPLEVFRQAWRNNIDPHNHAEPATPVLDSCLALARAYRLVDWDQAVPMAHDLFLDPQNRQGWLAQLQHYLVDEYQDFNRAEQAFISTLQSRVTSIVIVGDDNQSIYKTRGGSPDELRALFGSPDFDHISLGRSRRCKAEILKAANAFMLSMRPGAQRLLPNEAGGEIECYRFKSSKAECEFLLDYFRRRLEELPDEPRRKDGVVCLFPSKKLLVSYFDRIREHLPCYRKQAGSHPVREKLSRLLELTCNRGQRFIQRLILEDFPAIKHRHKREMVQVILANDVPPVDALEFLVANGRLSGKTAQGAQEFIELCRALSSQDCYSIARAISNLVPADIDLLREQIGRLLAGLGEADQSDIVTELCDQGIPESALPAEDLHAIQFLTMHGSKGLTKKTVVMPGLENAWLPGGAAGDDLAEKKRLYYVALTRATDHVLITFPSTRARGDPLNYPAVGRGEVSTFVTQSGVRVVYHE